MSSNGNPFAEHRDYLDRQIAERAARDQQTRDNYLAGKPPADAVGVVRYREFAALEQRAANREQADQPEQFTRLDDGRVLGGDGSPIPELTGPEWAERQEREAGS